MEKPEEVVQNDLFVSTLSFQEFHGSLERIRRSHYAEAALETGKQYLKPKQKS